MLKMKLSLWLEKTSLLVPVLGAIVLLAVLGFGGFYGYTAYAEKQAKESYTLVDPIALIAQEALEEDMVAPDNGHFVTTDYDIELYDDLPYSIYQEGHYHQVTLLFERGGEVKQFKAAVLEENGQYRVTSFSYPFDWEEETAHDYE